MRMLSFWIPFKSIYHPSTFIPRSIYIVSIWYLDGIKSNSDLSTQRFFHLVLPMHQIPISDSMNIEIQLILTNELAEFEKNPVVQDFKHRSFRRIYGIYLKLIYQKMSTCNRLDSETLGS